MPLFTLLLLTGLAAGPQTQVPGQLPEAGAASGDPTGGASGYTYDAQGRRDPFVSLAGNAADPRAAGARPVGVPGLLVSEVAVKGIMRSVTGFIAMLQGADARTYIVHGGDRLLDGSITSITKDEVVFAQTVDDPRSRVKTRDITKRVRAAAAPEEPARTLLKEPK